MKTLDQLSQSEREELLAQKDVNMTDEEYLASLTAEDLAIFSDEDEADESQDELPVDDGLAYVDLGLSVKWAKCNVGASRPEESGDYYAWGELETKEKYEWETYRYGKQTPFAKYQPETTVTVKHWFRADETKLVGDDKTKLDMCDDVASATLGGKWRMPTKREVAELVRECSWTTMYLNGVKGFKVRSCKKGYTRNWIFVPHCGAEFNANSPLVTTTTFWLSQMAPKDPRFALALTITKNWSHEGDVLSNIELSYGGCSRFAGHVIRPVMP